MARQYISTTDKLARQILKVATKGLADEPLTLSIAKSWFPEATWAEGGAAIAHGVEQGWLTEQGGAWLLTAAGEEIGRRSAPA